MKGAFNFWFPSNKPPEVGDVFILDADLNVLSDDAVKILITAVNGKYVRFSYSDKEGGFMTDIVHYMPIRELNWIFTKEKS